MIESLLVGTESTAANLFQFPPLSLGGCYQQWQMASKQATHPKCNVRNEWLLAESSSSI